MTGMRYCRTIRHAVSIGKKTTIETSRFVDCHSNCLSNYSPAPLEPVPHAHAKEPKCRSREMHYCRSTALSCVNASLINLSLILIYRVSERF